ncbi:MAG: InlB B-repeat-containing protein [Clostridia bacterium]|nr:InlB B-repeat-containing protein [Clostridia bacterium]
MLLKILAFFVSLTMMVTSTPLYAVVEELGDIIGNVATDSVEPSDSEFDMEVVTDEDFSAFVAIAPRIPLKSGNFISGTPVTVTSDRALDSISISADSGMKLSSSYTTSVEGTEDLTKYVYKYTVTGGTYSGSSAVTITANCTSGTTTKTIKTTTNVVKSPISTGALKFEFDLSYKRQDSWGSVTSNPILEYSLTVSGLHKVSTSSVYRKSAGNRSSDNYDSKTWELNFGDISSTYNGRFYYDKNTSNTIGKDYGATTLSTVRFSIYNPTNVMSEEGDGTPDGKAVRFTANYEDYMRPDTGFAYKSIDLLTMDTPGTVEYYLASAPYSAYNSNGIDTVKYNTTGVASCTNSSSAIYAKYTFAITYEWVDTTELWNIYKAENTLNRFTYTDLYKEADSDAWADYLEAYDNAVVILAGGYSQSSIDSAAKALVEAVQNLKTKVIYDKNGSTGNCEAYDYLNIYSDISVTASRIQAPVYIYNNAELTSYSELVKTGYLCQGWAMDSASKQGVSVLTIPESATKTPIKLYAAWSSVNYTVVYNANKPAGSAIVGTVESQECYYDQVYTYRANNYIVTNYKFEGWNTKSDGSGTMVNPGDRFYNLSTTGGIVNLYAIWRMDAVSVIFNINLPVGVSATTSGFTENTTMEYDIGQNVDLTSFTMDSVGYKHIGWSTQSSATTPTYTDNFTVPQSGITLYAVWQKKTIVVNYALTGGELLEGDYTGNNELVEYNGIVDLPLNSEIKRSGYRLSGWICSLDNKVYSRNYTVPNTNTTTVTFTAEWTYKTTRIYLHDNNQELVDTQRGISGTYTNPIDKSKFTDPAITDDVSGLVFTGWYVKEGTTYVKYDIPATFPAEDLHLYAGWQMVELFEAMQSVPADIYSELNGDPYYLYSKDAKDAVLSALEDAEEIYGINGIIFNPTDLRIANLTTENLNIALLGLSQKFADYSQVKIYQTYYQEIITATHEFCDDDGVIHSGVSDEYFTPETFNAFKEANDVVYSGLKTSEQSIVDGWAADLKATYEALELKKADYSQLYKYYEICYELNGSDTEVFNEESDGNKYYSDGWAEFFDLVWNVAKAECEEGRDMSYQSVIDDYVLMLEETYNMMQLRAPDFSAFTEELQISANNINAQSSTYENSYRGFVVDALMLIISAQNNGELSLKNDQDYVDGLISDLKELINNPVYKSYTITFHYNGYLGESLSDIFDIATLPCNESIASAAPYYSPVRDGYIFLGWYTTAEDTADEIGRKIDFETTTELMGTADRDIYARWEMTDSGFVLNVKGTNATIKVGFYEDELVNQGIEYVNNNVFRGTPVVLKAEATVNNAEFLYWADANGRIVSTKAEYSFILVADTKLEAVYSEGTESDTYKVIFVDGVTNKILETQTVTANTRAQKPTLINHEGYKFTKYSESLNITKDTVIYAEYETANEKYTVTVKNEKGTLNPTGEYEYNTRVTVSLKETEIPEGKYFAGWTLDGGNTVASYELAYTFYVYGNAEVEALFADMETEKISTVTISTNKTENAVAFMVTREITEGEFFLSSGLLITKDKANATEDTLTLDNESENEEIKNFTTIKNDKSGQYKLTVSSTSGAEYYARGYIVYKDADGKIQIKYTEILNVVI